MAKEGGATPARGARRPHPPGVEPALHGRLRLRADAAGRQRRVADRPHRLAVHAASPANLWATRSTTSGADPVACRSTDGGLTWTEVHRLVSAGSREYFDIEVSQTDPLDAVKAVRDGSFSFFLERTSDGGASWGRTPVPRGAFYCCMRRSPSESSAW